jgi:hypothetical protein
VVGGERDCAFAFTSCHTILSALRTEYGQLIATSAMASGSDTIFGEAALALGIPIERVRPFRRYAEDFAELEQQARYERIVDNATSCVDVRFEERDRRAYRKAMQWTVMRSDVVVAVWDGQRSGAVGGTWEALELAWDLGLPVVHVNAVTRTTRMCASADDGHVMAPGDAAKALREVGVA